MGLYVPDWFTFALSIIGIIVSLLYLLKAWFSVEDIDTKLKKNLAKWIKTDDKGLGKHEKMNVVLKDYEISNVTVHRRDNIALLVGSILIGASFLILANTSLSSGTYPMGVYALASIGLYCIWLLFLHLTSKMLNDYAYPRIRAIEEALSEKEVLGKLGYEFGIHSYIVKKTRTCDKEKPVWWLRLRRAFWGMILLLLSIAWMLLSLA